MPKRLKVLMSAYACEPNRGSEPGVGWNWALQMARFHDVTVVTRANNRTAIEAALSQFQGSLPEFAYYDPPGCWLKWKHRGLPVALFYARWQAGVRGFLASRLTDFDLIHHVTFNSFRQPGFWWGLNRPVILGPLGGGQICPWPFLLRFGSRLIPEAARSLSVVGSPLLLHLHASFGAATRILVANQDTARRIPRRFQNKVIPMLETGIPASEIFSKHTGSRDGLVRVLWLSRLEKIKGGSLTLRAFSHAVQEFKELRLTMVGGGPEEPNLRQLSQRLGLQPWVTWRGAVTKSEVAPLMAAHDIFLFSSLRDTSGNVLLEAMAAGLPAVTLRHHGAAEIATDDTALRVPVDGCEQTIAGVAQALVKLGRSEPVRVRLGEAALARVSAVYDWQRKGEAMDRIYHEAVAAYRG